MNRLSQFSNECLSAPQILRRVILGIHEIYTLSVDNSACVSIIVCMYACMYVFVYLFESYESQY